MFHSLSIKCAPCAPYIRRLNGSSFVYCNRSAFNQYILSSPFTVNDHFICFMQDYLLLNHCVIFSSIFSLPFSAFTKTKQCTCFCCGVLEKYYSCNEKGRDPIFHLLYYGASARFLRNHLTNYARRISGQSFEININSIIFNEVPFDIAKRCNNPSLRRWYTIVNIFKTALSAVYYRRSMFDRNGNVIIKTFNHHLRAIKRTAKERRSDILDNIWFLPEKDDSVVPFYKILNETHQKLLFTGDKTTRISVFYRTIEKDYQELKIFTKNNIFRKFLRKRDSY